MKNKIILLIGIAIITLQCANQENQESKGAGEEETWTVLFDGSSTDQWRDTKTELFPGNGWMVEGSVLTVLGKTEDQEGGHDIITKEQFGNFELELEVKLTEGANSGIKYVVSDAFPGKEGSYLGLEYQLLDNENHEDAQKGRNGNHKMAGLYDLIPPPENLPINPPGQWNKVRIMLDGDKVEHWLNDKKVLEFDRKSPAFRELVSQSKYKNLKNFGESDRGHLLLQGHGNDVSFRAIKIRTW